MSINTQDPTVTQNLDQAGDRDPATPNGSSYPPRKTATRGKFPLEHFPSIPSDGYIRLRRQGEHPDDGKDADYEDEPDHGETFGDNEELPPPAVLEPPLLPFVYPPSTPLNMDDPTWLAALLSEAKRQRSFVHEQLDEARAIAASALTEFNLAQQEYNKEAEETQSFLNTVAKVAGAHVVRRMLKSVEHELKQMHEVDEEDGDEGENGSGGGIAEDAPDDQNGGEQDASGSESRSKSPASSISLDGEIPTSHELVHYVLHNPIGTLSPFTTTSEHGSDESPLTGKTGFSCPSTLDSPIPSPRKRVFEYDENYDGDTASEGHSTHPSKGKDNAVARIGERSSKRLRLASSTCKGTLTLDENCDDDTSGNHSTPPSKGKGKAVDRHTTPSARKRFLDTDENYDDDASEKHSTPPSKGKGKTADCHPASSPRKRFLEIDESYDDDVSVQPSTPPSKGKGKVVKCDSERSSKRPRLEEDGSPATTSHSLSARLVSTGRPSNPTSAPLAIEPPPATMSISARWQQSRSPSLSRVSDIPSRSAFSTPVRSRVSRPSPPSSSGSSNLRYPSPEDDAQAPSQLAIAGPSRPQLLLDRRRPRRLAYDPERLREMDGQPVVYNHFR